MNVPLWHAEIKNTDVKMKYKIWYGNILYHAVACSAVNWSESRHRQSRRLLDYLWNRQDMIIF